MKCFYTFIQGIAMLFSQFKNEPRLSFSWKRYSFFVRYFELIDDGIASEGAELIKNEQKNLKGKITFVYIFTYSWQCTIR